jgi:hypothetical protein
MNWRVGSGTKTRQLLCGRSTSGHMPRGVCCGKAKMLWLGRRSCCDQDGHARACQRRLNRLMAQMADGAVVG